jgi:cobalt/nickel transport system permease protein
LAISARRTKQGVKFNLDEYVYLNSPIHTWEPRCKLVGLTMLIFAFAFVEDWQLIPLMLAVTVVIYALSKLPWCFLQSRLRYPGLFILAVVAVLPFASGSTILWQWGALTLRQEGLLAVILIGGRFFSIVTLGLILFGTTPFLTTVKTMRSLGLPNLLADLLLLSYRYLFDLAEMLATMRQAMRLRGFQSRRPSQGWFIPNSKDLQQFASLTGTLLLRSYEQSERVYQAMRLRGYGQPTKVQFSRRHTGNPTHLGSALGLVGACLTASGFVVAELLKS